jgi:hypothetical protein
MTEVTPQTLLVDIKAHIAGSKPAEALERRLLEALAGFAPRIAETAKPYWKIPEWHECTLELKPADRAGFDAVIALAKKNWHRSLDDEGGDCDGIWNPEPGHVFLLPEVTWAHVLLVTPNPPSPDMEYTPL